MQNSRSCHRSCGLLYGNFLSGSDTLVILSKVEGKPPKKPPFANHYQNSVQHYLKYDVFLSQELYNCFSNMIVT
jgi:hypothetical protein